MNFSKFPARMGLAAALAAALTVAPEAQAITASWGGTTNGLWSTSTNWTGGVVPGTNDSAIFSASPNLSITPGTITIRSIIFAGATAGAYTFLGGVGDAITLNNSGSIIKNGEVAAAQTISTPIILGHTGATANFTFTSDNVTTALTIAGTVTGSTGAGVKTLTVSGNGVTNLNGIVANGTDGTVGLIKTGNGTLQMGGQANAFTGNAVVKQGVLAGGANAATFGTGNSIVLGDSVLGQNAILSVGSNGITYAQPITVAAGAGTRTIRSTNTAAGTVTLSGAIALNNNLLINASGTAAGGTAILNLTGGITGTGNVTFSSGGVAARTATISGASLNNVGLVTNASTGAAAATVSSVIGANVTGVVQNSVTSVMLLSGANVYTAPTTVSAGTLRAGIASVANTSGAFGVNSAVTIADVAGATLDLNNFDNRIGSLAGGGLNGGNVVLGSATLTTGANDTDTTYAGIISGAGGLTKIGAGTQTLSGASSFTGATNVTGGTLRVDLSTGSIASTSKIDVAAGATLDFTGGTFTLGSLKALSGSGTVGGVVTAANGSIISPGTRVTGLGGTGALTVGSLALENGSSLNFGLSASDSLNSYLSATSLTFADSGAITLNLYTPGTSTPFSEAGTYTLFQYTSLAGGAPSSLFQIGTSLTGLSPTFGTTAGPGGTTYITLTLAASGVTGNWIGAGGNSNWSTAGNWQSGNIPGSVGDTAIFGGDATPGTVTLNSNRTVGTLSFNTNSGSYTITGANTLTLEGNGATASIQATGIHEVQTALALADNLSVTPAAGSELTLSGAISETTPGKSVSVVGGTGVLNLSGTNTYSGGTFINDGGAVKFSSLASLGTGGITFANGALIYNGNTDDISSRTVTINAGGATFNTGSSTVTFASAIGNSGVGSLTKAGSGVLNLAADNTYTGGTIIKAGTLGLAADTSLGALPLVAGTNLTFDAGAGNTATLRTNANMTLSALRGVLLNSGTGEIDTVANTVSVDGVISGTGILQKKGAGILTLNGANSYSGGTVVTEGSLYLGNFGSAGTGAITLANGTTLRPSAGGNSNNVQLSGAGANVFILSNSAANGLGGAISGTADQTLTMTGATQVNFGAGNTQQFANFLGTVSLPVGTAIRFSSTGLDNGGSGTTFAVNGVLNTRNNGAVAIGALTGSGVVTMGAAGPSNLGVTYTIGAKGIDSVFSGEMRDGDALTGRLLSVVKTGAATLTLSGVNTYTGATTVNAGKLVVNGSLAAASVVTVGPAGTLGGTGSVGQVVANGTLAPGNSIGTITTGNLTIGATGTLQIELGVNAGLAVSDRANVAGLVSLLDGANLALTLLSGLDTPAINDVFFLVVNDMPDAVTGVFSSIDGIPTTLTEGSWFQWNSQEYQITYQAHAEGSSFFGGNDIAIKAVPEPGTIALLLGGLGVLAFLQVRRRSREA